MKNFMRIFIVFTSILIFSNCATILSKSTYPFTVNTDPSGVKVVIKNGEGKEIYKGNSPASVKLKAGEGFFKKASYTVTVTLDGYVEQTLPINFKLDGWYWGNLLLFPTGVVGLLIVDPASGAMYKLEDEYMNINLRQSNASIDSPSFNVYDIANTPQEWKDNLIKINL
jgi:hypothetical protein